MIYYRRHTLVLNEIFLSFVLNCQVCIILDLIHINTRFCFSPLASPTDKEKEKTFLSQKESRRQEWIQQLDSSRQQLMREIEEKKDILIVDVLDTYRNLPQKVLRSIDYFWHHQTRHPIDFWLKTDDDCYLDIERIRELLLTHSQSKEKEFSNGIPGSWFGNFRTNWMLDQYGKWAEREYKSLTYPPFPCGSGYVLERKLIEFLVKNQDLLHNYQGEDVSMGIWLSPLNPVRRHDDGWLCSKEELSSTPTSSSDSFLSVPNLKPTELRLLHQSKRRWA